jgi:hypothetical protein
MVQLLQTNLTVNQIGEFIIDFRSFTKKIIKIEEEQMLALIGLKKRLKSREF